MIRYAYDTRIHMIHYAYHTQKSVKIYASGTVYLNSKASHTSEAVTLTDM